MKHILTFCFIALFAISVSSQVKETDSLINVLATQKLPPNKELEIYEKISFFYARNDLEKGLEYASKGLQLALKEKNKKMESSFYRNLGIVYMYKSAYDTAQTYLDKALNLALEVEDKTMKVKIYVDLANLYSYQNYEKALEYYLKALSFSENQPDKTTAIILNNIAEIHRVLKNHHHAISFFKQSLDIAEQLNLENVKMYACNGLGGVYASQGDTDKAIPYFQKALSINENIGNNLYKIASLIGLSSQLALKKEFEKSLENCYKAMEIAEAIRSPRELCNVLTVLSDVYREMGNYKECEKIALKSWAIDSVSYDIAAGTAKTLSVAYIHLEKKEKAEYFLRKFYEMYAEGNEKSLHESLANMEVKYDTEKKELRIASLEKERKLYILLNITGVLLAISLGVSLWLKIRNTKKERLLLAATAVQEGEIGERERLASELHDRLGGTLSAAKSELNNTNDISWIHNKLDVCIEEVRRITHNMMPLSLRFGIKAALEDFTSQFPNVHFHYFGEKTILSKRLEFVVYCCANELVTNSLRHSGAKNINVQLVQEEKRIALTVQDDGCGFDKETVKKGIGLKTIHDRVASCDGKIEIVSPLGKGTEITIEFKTENK